MVSNFIVQALRDNPSPSMERASRRAFCYVDDLIEGIVRLMNTEGLTGPVNLGNPAEFTILELAESDHSLTGSRSEIGSTARCRRTTPRSASRTSHSPGKARVGAESPAEGRLAADHRLLREVPFHGRLTIKQLRGDSEIGNHTRTPVLAVERVKKPARGLKFSQV